MKRALLLLLLMFALPVKADVYCCDQAASDAYKADLVVASATKKEGFNTKKWHPTRAIYGQPYEAQDSVKRWGITWSWPGFGLLTTTGSQHGNKWQLVPWNSNVGYAAQPAGITASSRRVLVGAGGWFRPKGYPDVNFYIDGERVAEVSESGHGEWMFIGYIGDGFKTFELSTEEGSTDTLSFDDWLFGRR